MAISFSGVVLAAGRSTRMGRDKAILESDGEPLWRRQREVLVLAGAAEVFLSARADQKWADATDGFAALVRDPVPDCGPIGGIAATLRRSARTHVAVLAIDLPRMSAEWFAGLAKACRPGVGAVGRREGRYEPLAAIYPRELGQLADYAIAVEDYSLQRLLEAAMHRGILRSVEIGDGERGSFTNWNEPTDLRRDTRQ